MGLLHKVITCLLGFFICCHISLFHTGETDVLGRSEESGGEDSLDIFFHGRNDLVNWVLPCMSIVSFGLDSHHALANFKCKEYK